MLSNLKQHNIYTSPQDDPQIDLPVTFIHIYVAPNQCDACATAPDIRMVNVHEDTFSITV